MGTRILKAAPVLLVTLAVVVSLAVPAPARAARDVVFVIDNSGSMARNDPGFIVRDAVADYAADLDAGDRVGLVLFDRTVRMPTALTAVDAGGLAALTAGLAKIDYRGQFTDSPAGIERALYALSRAEGDHEAIIVFLTDGIVDTGNAQLDAERVEWLREDLSSEAAEKGIRIFGIAFTENSDSLLVQSLARRTGADYFRALTDADLPAAFADVFSASAQSAPLPAREATPAQAPAFEPPPPPPSLEAPMPAEAELLPDEKAAIEEFDEALAEAGIALDDIPEGQAIIIPPERGRGEFPLALAGVVAAGLLALCVVAYLLLRRRPARPAAEPAPGAVPIPETKRPEIPEAYLVDVDHVTERDRHPLHLKSIMIGRVAGPVSTEYEYLVIRQPTIGRQHAVIKYQDFAYWVVDQGSVNGTFVNDERVAAPTRLNHGDTVRFHKVRFRIEITRAFEQGEGTAYDATVMADTEATMAASADALAGGATAVFGGTALVDSEALDQPTAPAATGPAPDDGDATAQTAVFDALPPVGPQEADDAVRAFFDITGDDGASPLDDTQDDEVDFTATTVVPGAPPPDAHGALAGSTADFDAEASAFFEDGTIGPPEQGPAGPGDTPPDLDRTEDDFVFIETDSGLMAKFGEATEPADDQATARMRPPASGSGLDAVQRPRAEPAAERDADGAFAETALFGDSIQATGDMAEFFDITGTSAEDPIDDLPDDQDEGAARSNRSGDVS